jgi:hypothetical protein
MERDVRAADVAQAVHRPHYDTLATRWPNLLLLAHSHAREKHKSPGTTCWNGADLRVAGLRGFQWKSDKL